MSNAPQSTKGYSTVEERIQILQYIRSLPKDTPLDKVCKEKGVRRRTLSRWASQLDFNLKKRVWARGTGALSRANLKRGDEGEQLARTHGARAFLTTGLLTCRQTCVVWDDCQLRVEHAPCGVLDIYTDAKRKEIMKQPSVDESRDGLLIERALRLLGTLLMLDLYIAKEGFFVVSEKGATLNPVLNEIYLGYSRAVVGILKDLGMTPSAARQFQEDREPVLDISTRVAKLRREDADR